MKGEQKKTSTDRLEQRPFRNEASLSVLQRQDHLFESLMNEIGTMFDGDHIYVCENVGTDDMIHSYIWSRDGIHPIQINTIVSKKEIEEKYPGIWNQDVVITDHSIAARLMLHHKILGMICIENPSVQSQEMVKKLWKILSFLLSSLLYSGKLIQRLQALDFEDRLTQVGNLNALLAHLDELSSEKSLGVIFGDVSELKEVNDTYGHEAGNQLLIKTASIFTLSFGDEAVFRVGGDEFIVLCSGMRKDTFLLKVQQLRLNFLMRGINIAIGQSWVPVFTDDFAKIREQADQQMYEEKRKYYERKGVGEKPRHDTLKLHESRERRYQGDGDMIPCPFITVQLERDAASLITDIRVLTVNDAFLRIYGLSEQRWIGQSLLPFLRGPFRWLWKHIYEAINEKRSVTVSYYSHRLQREVAISIKMTSDTYGSVILLPIERNNRL